MVRRRRCVEWRWRSDEKKKSIGILKIDAVFVFSPAVGGHEEGDKTRPFY